MIIKITQYYYATEEELRDTGIEYGLTGKALKYYTLSADEIEVELEVDSETGRVLSKKIEK